MDWLLVNTSPDIRAQLAAFKPFQPGRGLRDTGIRSVLLIDSQIDHSTGLLMLREGEKIDLYCTEPVQQDLSSGFPIINMLSHYCGVNLHTLELNSKPFEIPAIEGLEFTAVPLSSKAPPYSPHRNAPVIGDNIGLFVRDTITGKSLFYSPGLGEFEAHLHDYFSDSDLLMVDGTFFTEDEMITRGVGVKPAATMGHLPQSGRSGMLSILAKYPDKRRILIHINNTNPILMEDSPERRTVEEQGIEVSYDGMDISL